MTLQPAWSHLNTLVPVARALEARGHEVRVATAPSFTEAVRARGLRAVPAGLDWEASRADDFFPGYLAARAASQVGLLVSLAGRGMFDDLLALCGAWPPDVIIRDASEFGAIFVGAKLRIPVVVLGIGLRPPVDWLFRLQARRFSALREQFGLPQEALLGDVTGALWISSYPASFGLERVGDLAELHVSPVIADDPLGETGPDWLDDLPDDSVYVSLGTVFNQNLDLLRLLVRTLADEAGLTVVATTGNGTDPRALKPHPSRARVLSYLPQSLIAPRVKAVVSHGGFNTMMGALAMGVPVCCLPLGADHPQNARRCVELGVGTALTTGTPTWGDPVARPLDVTAAGVLQSVLPLLHDPTYRLRATAMADEIRATPGPEVAAESIEALVHAR
jgi:UDP:flavonoid glycosyltransferase YjiC (YdhE family)